MATMTASSTSDVETVEVAVRGSDGISGKQRRSRPVKITVNLIARAWESLEQVCVQTGESKTDAINRAIQLYTFVQSMIKSGHVIRLVGPNGEEKEIHLF